MYTLKEKIIVAKTGTVLMILWYAATALVMIAEILKPYHFHYT